MVKVELFSQGKTTAFNDDVALYNGHSWVVWDGASDTYNRQYDGKHSGALAARAAADGALSAEYNGTALSD
jgi:hypothetical protein